MVAVFFPDDDAGSTVLGGKADALRRFQDMAPRWGAEVPAFFVLPGDAPLTGLDAALARLGDGPFAVRSSGAAEDGGADSFAGQFHTVLDVAAEQVAGAVLEVRRSAESESVLAYCRSRGLPPPAVPAVIVQRMVAADTAGVAFSADPVSGARDVAVVAAVRGLGERLVSGADSGETWRLGPGAILDQPASLILTQEQARAVAALARGLAGAAGRPQDVEWAVAGDRLYLLQSRPITMLPPDPAGRLVVWDNSNIVESYSGVTTPLTFSFAHRAYGAVYTQLVRLLGVPEAVVRRRQDVLRDMVGLVHGRVYYNLLNWYHALALLPGFAVTRGHMETMMGVDRALSAELAAAVEAERIRGGSAEIEALRVARIVVTVLYRRACLPQDVRRFHARLDAVLGEPALQPAGLPLDRLSALYRRLEERLLGDWSTPLVNDLACMVSFGILKRLLVRWCGDDDGRLCNTLLVGQGGIISAEPARRVREMAALAAQYQGLPQKLVGAPEPEALAALRNHAALAAAFDAYLERFGDRCIGELKLESPTLADEPLGLVRAIGQAALAPHRTVAPEAPVDLTEAVKALPAWRRALVRLIAGEARDRVRDRENMRFERTRVFGRMRRVALEMGRRLAEDGRIETPRDVFHLTLDELLGLAEGSAVTVQLRDLIALRQRQFDDWRAAPPPPRRFATRGAPAFSPFLPLGETAPVEAGEARGGLGCCPGVVRGRVQVVRDPATDLFPPGAILVAEATDPGWVTLIAAAAGMVVERGSLLSHSAIVAREMGVPTVVGLADAATWLRSGDVIELDGGAGTVCRLAGDPP